MNQYTNTNTNNNSSSYLFNHNYNYTVPRSVIKLDDGQPVVIIKKSITKNKICDVILAVFTNISFTEKSWPIGNIGRNKMSQWQRNIVDIM